MTEKRLGAKPLDYATDMFVNILEPPIIDVPDQTKQEEWLKQRIISALDDCPKKVGYLVMEMNDKGDVE